jgi:hypothetical protein
MAFIDKVPILVVFLAVLVVAFAAVEVGYRLASWRPWGEKDDKYPIETAASRTLLGLLAFLLAFSFGGTAGRYKDQRGLVEIDNNAIGNAYRSTDFLPEGVRTEGRDLIREYMIVRHDAIVSRDREKMKQALVWSRDIQEELWDIGVAARLAPDGSVSSTFVGAVSELIDSHNARVQKGLLTRTPLMIWLMLGLLLLLGGTMLGYFAGLHGRRSGLSTTLVIFAFSAVLIMVVDLDRPFRSLFGSGSDPMAEELLESMQADVDAGDDGQHE